MISPHPGPCSSQATRHSDGKHKLSLHSGAIEKPAAVEKGPAPCEAHVIDFSEICGTLWEFNITMEHHNFQWLNALQMAVFNSHVQLSEGKPERYGCAIC